MHGLNPLHGFSRYLFSFLQSASIFRSSKEGQELRQATN
jgi:hypothetical protein